MSSRIVVLPVRWNATANATFARAFRVSCAKALASGAFSKTSRQIGGDVRLVHAEQTPLAWNAVPARPESAGARQAWRRWRGGGQLFGLSCAGAGKPTNEDAILVREGRPTLLVVADGVGGGQRPEVAAQAVVEAVAAFRDLDRRTLRAALIEADVAVRDAIAAVSKGAGGATGVAAIVSGGEAAVSHVGDARAMLIRRPSWLRAAHQCVALTTDQTYENEGRLPPGGHPRNAPSRVLGLGARPSETVTARLHDGDVLLLCSDGLAKRLAPQEIEDFARLFLRGRTEQGPVEFARALTRQAVSNGGRDDISIVVYRRQAPVRPSLLLALALAALIGFSL
jgi:protein phosphatase